MFGVCVGGSLAVCRGVCLCAVCGCVVFGLSWLELAGVSASSLVFASRRTRWRECLSVEVLSVAG